ncbi:lantibiotic dehydratase [Streptomyces coeruleoprunus]|uniref:Lantibiotic dehydratase n=1 Tax=Streptomyces coeruleoprunus TaxID=285563 RepID=A0ABV9XMG8_9ACTN
MALLRIAGMPCDRWTEAGSPALFARVVRHADAAGLRAARARALAERLGAEVVPSPLLAGTARRAVLALRRRLHAGAAPDVADCRLLDRSPAVPPDLAAEARALREADVAAAAEGLALERALADEQVRVAARGWETARTSPLMRAFLDSAAPGLAEDVERRLAEGGSWHDKQLRKRAAYLWRVLARAAAKTTPRGWAGQLAAIDVGEDSTGAAGASVPLWVPSPLTAEAGADGGGASRLGSGPGADGRGASPIAAEAGADGGGGSRPAADPAADGDRPSWLAAGSAADGRGTSWPVPGAAANGDRPSWLATDPAADGSGASWPVPDPAADGRGTSWPVPGAGADGGHPSRPVPGARADGDGAWLVGSGAWVGAVAAGAVENVHLVRARAGVVDLREAGPDTLLVPAPLHFTEPGAVRCWVVEPHAPGRLRQVVLRRTAALQRVLALCAEGPVALGDLEKALSATASGAAPQDPAVLRGFLRHLAARGVLQVCAAPRQRYTAWAEPGVVTTPQALPRPVGAEDGDPAGWFLDSYRRLDATVPAGAAERVERGLRIAARMAALRDTAATSAWPPAEVLAGLTDEPRPVSELLAERLARADGAQPGGAARHRYAGWPAAADPGSGYAAMLAHLAAHAHEDGVDVDDALLDAWGAPPADEALPPWPRDCLLRPLPGPGPLAVLETASAAGVLDARFADGLRTLCGTYGGADAYRAFLASVEREAGVRFVELLVPPLGERAANAVRRPVTTAWWTGDPDPAPYYGGDGGRARYLPLDRITLRRACGRVVAEADGRRVLPVHHATRTPAPPYDVLLRLLLAAGPPPTRSYVRLDGPAAALPGLARVPRVTVGGELVVAPATWRVSRSRLWHAGDPPLAKVRTLALLRRSAGLPRYAFVRTGAEAKPVPVDLASVTAIGLVERLCAQQAGGELLVEEMLPGPGDLVLRDALHGGAPVAAQVLLRLPHGPAAERLAARAAAGLAPVAAAPDVPGRRPPRGRTAGAAITS